MGALLDLIGTPTAMKTRLESSVALANYIRTQASLIVGRPWFYAKFADHEQSCPCFLEYRQICLKEKPRIGFTRYKINQSGRDAPFSAKSSAIELLGQVYAALFRIEAR